MFLLSSRELSPQALWPQGSQVLVLTLLDMSEGPSDGHGLLSLLLQGTELPRQIIHCTQWVTQGQVWTMRGREDSLANSFAPDTGEAKQNQDPHYGGRGPSLLSFRGRRD